MKAALLVVSMAVMATIAVADETATDSTSIDNVDANHWMTYYYQNPRPDQVLEAVRICHDSAWLSTDGHPHVVVAFVSEVLKQSPELIPVVIDSCPFLNSEETAYLSAALWFCGTDDCIKQLEAMAEKNPAYREILNSPRTNLLDMQDVNPGVFDMYWAAFFASGDTRYVQKLINVLDHKPDQEHPEEIVYVASAYWSLKSNCIQHPKVLEYCKSVVDTLSSGTKAELTEILEVVTKQ